MNYDARRTFFGRTLSRNNSMTYSCAVMPASSAACLMPRHKSTGTTMVGRVVDLSLISVDCDTVCAVFTHEDYALLTSELQDVKTPLHL
jgi:hypothetical protein